MNATLPIVGAYFRPPAKALIDALPIGAQLILRADPFGNICDVEHDDPNAISVWLPAASLPAATPELVRKLEGYGFTLDELRRSGVLHIGYVPREDAAQLCAHGFPAEGNIDGSFTVTARGAPRVSFSF
jgi:hypothetical protein